MKINVKSENRGEFVAEIVVFLCVIYMMAKLVGILFRL